MPNFKDVVVSPDTSLQEAISKIDASGLQVALITNDSGKLLGILTDGNIRRAILYGYGLQTPVSSAMHSSPTTVLVSTPREEILSLMRAKTLHHIPLVDDEGRLEGLITLDELVGAVERSNWVVLMAGGLGARLRPLTNDCPKPLLDMGGKPILETIVERFANQGFRRVFLSVTYKAEMIRDHFGAGDRWGVQVDYLHENKSLGTAGALSLLPNRPTEPFIVMNGDLLTHTNFDGLLKFHNERGAVGTMAVREYDFQVPYGIVRLDGATIQAIEEKPIQKFFINAGIYALSPEALVHLPSQTFFDMPTLFQYLIAAEKTVVAYPLREYWVDIGRIEELERAQKEWSRRTAEQPK